MSETYMKPKQLSQLLHIPEKTLAQYRSNGKVKIPFLKVGGHVLYKLSDVLRFMEGCTAGEHSSR